MGRAVAMGMTGEELGLKAGLAAAGIFPAVMILCLLWLRRGGKSDN